MNNPEGYNDEAKPDIDVVELDPNDPEDKDILDSLEVAGQEFREQFQTIELAVDAYNKGFITYGALCLGYPEEEVQKLLQP